MSGAPVFVGTRVPAAILIDHLAHGSTLDEFLEDFPSVTREPAIVFLLQSAEALLERIGAPLPPIHGRSAK